MGECKLPHERGKNMKKTLTATVLSASLVARPSYEGFEGTRWKKGSQPEHLNGLLGSYAGAKGDIDDDFAYLIIAGKNVIPVSVVEHYREGTSLCPIRLYDDIKSYLELPSISHSDRCQLLANLYAIIDDIPVRDRHKMINAVEACRYDKDCMLLTCLLYYAWRTDLAQYTYAAA